MMLVTSRLLSADNNRAMRMVKHKFTDWPEDRASDLAHPARSHDDGGHVFLFSGLCDHVTRIHALL